MNRPASSRPLESELTATAALPLRVCTICDGVDAVIRLASWLAHLPATAERVDLELSESMSWLSAQAYESFDMLVVAPNGARSDVTPRLVRAVLAETRRRAALQIVLMPAGGRLSLPDLPEVHILTGPPFPPPAMLNRRPEPPSLPEVDSPPPRLGRADCWHAGGRSAGVGRRQRAPTPRCAGRDRCAWLPCSRCAAAPGRAVLP